MTARAKVESGELETASDRVTWVRNGAPARRPLYVCGHGAGAPYTSAFMQAVAEGLDARGVCVVRFHFPYMERSVRDRRPRSYPPDRPAVLLETCRAIVDLAISWLPKTRRAKPPVFVGGKSMGGRMMSMLLAEDDAPPLAGAVYLGYPLHPPGRTDKLRTAHLSQVRVPQLFVSGTRDALAKMDLLQPVVKKLRGATLYWVEGGDHSLAARRARPLEGSDAWLDAVADFIKR